MAVNDPMKKASNKQELNNADFVAWSPDINRSEEIRNRVDEIIESYCSKYDVDEKDIAPAIWNDILQECYMKLFRLFPSLLKLENDNHNSYDVEKIYIIYNNIYKRICNNHKKVISIYGFCEMIGIERQTIYNMSKQERLGSLRIDIHEKIMNDSENSLESALQDKSINPMKILPSLNRRFQWNLPGVSKENADKRIATRENAAAAIEQQSIPELPN